MNRSICLFTDSLDPSGVGAQMLTLARHLASGHRLCLVCPPTPAGKRLLERARELGMEALALRVRDTPSERPLAEWLRDQRIDLLHVHAGIGWEGHHGVYAAEWIGLPVIRTEHLPYLLTRPEQQRDYRGIVERCDRIICVSEGVRDSHAAAGVATERIRVVRNGIDPAPVEADRAEVRSRFGLPPGVRLVVTVGRFTEQKGHRFLLGAVSAVGEAIPEVRFLWVGDGPLRRELEGRAAAMGVSDRIIFAGRRSDVPELLAAADLFVLPSRFEGLPLVVLEAMAAGLPVIGTRVCGTAEAVEESVTGRVVPPCNSTALATAILDVLQDPERARRWADAGRERVRTEFSAVRMARETAAVYAEFLESSRLPAPGRRNGRSRGIGEIPCLISFPGIRERGT